MGRNRINSYLDIVVTHPEMTEEELDDLIKEEEKKSAQLTDWQKM